MNKVPENGSCTAAGPHLVPYGGPNDTVVCDRAAPQLCQVGDLSGKNGKITPENGKFNTQYSDDFISTNPDSPAFFGNRSLVLHNKNGTRINCGNFIPRQNATGPIAATSSSTAVTQPSQTSSTTGISATPTGTPAPSNTTNSAPSQYPGNAGSAVHVMGSLSLYLITLAMGAALWL
jgi:hypothetical protein